MNRFAPNRGRERARRHPHIVVDEREDGAAARAHGGVPAVRDSFARSNTYTTLPGSAAANYCTTVAARSFERLSTMTNSKATLRAYCARTLPMATSSMSQRLRVDMTTET